MWSNLFYYFVLFFYFLLNIILTLNFVTLLDIKCGLTYFIILFFTFHLPTSPLYLSNPPSDPPT